MPSQRYVIFALAAGMLAGCASDFGGSVASNGQDVLSPEERRLQAVESRVSVLTRRIDAANLSEMDQGGQRLRDDVRTLRGDVERLRYDVDRATQRTQALEARVQQLEAAMGGAAPAYGAPTGSAAPAMPPPATGSTSTPTTSAVAGAGAAATVAPTSSSSMPPVTISQNKDASLEEEKAYLAAFDQLKNGKYDDALRAFRKQLEQWPRGQYADSALYWSGEAYYVKRDYKGALAAFNAVLQHFPRSRKAPDALLKVGLTQMEMGQTNDGKATLKKVIASYPDTDVARLAQQRLEPPKR